MWFKWKTRSSMRCLAYSWLKSTRIIFHLISRVTCHSWHLRAQKSWRTSVTSMNRWWWTTWESECTLSSTRRSRRSRRRTSTPSNSTSSNRSTSPSQRLSTGIRRWLGRCRSWLSRSRRRNKWLMMIIHLLSQEQPQLLQNNLKKPVTRTGSQNLQRISALNNSKIIPT
jgi:hypothetical protein